MTEFAKQKKVIIISGAVAIFAVCAYLFLYSPLLNRLRIESTESRKLEDTLLRMRDLIALAETKGEAAGSKYVLINEEEIAAAIEQLTQRGREEGINFISVTPGQIEKSKDGSFRSVPIELEMESSYKGLGVFLGSLDELSGALVKVRKFDAVPRKEDPEKLTTKLAVDIYLAEENGE